VAEGYIPLHVREEKMGSRRAYRTGEIYTGSDVFASGDLDIPAVRRLGQNLPGTQMEK
jgi:hypothetical protein